MRSLRLLNLWMRTSKRSAKTTTHSMFRSARPHLEALEARALLTTFAPSPIHHEFGFDRVGIVDAGHSLATRDGHGRAIAAVESHDDLNIATGLGTKVNPPGGTALPAARVVIHFGPMGLNAHLHPWRP